MSRIACTRVGCLRIPWFPIDVLRRSGRVAKGSALALVAGKGTHAKIAAMDPAARATGARIGMRPSQARGLSASLELAPWDEELDRALTDASDKLARHLEELSPRLTVAALGVWWLEPAAPRVGPGPGAGGSREMEAAFARSVLAMVTGEGFGGSRVAIADGPVAAEAATRVGGHPIRTLSPGSDRRFLADLPIEALRVSAGVRSLLRDLGVRRVGTLQGMNAHELQARFGPEGRWAWRVACGDDPRRPVTPRPRPELRTEVVLDGATDRIEPLLFALRPAVQRVVRRIEASGKAVGRATLELRRAWGPDVVVEVAPSRPAADEDLVFELVRRRLQEPGLLDPSGGPVSSVCFEVVWTPSSAPRQGELFAAAWLDPAASEAALVRLTGRLGEAAVVHSVVMDDHRPERRGRWRPVAGNRDPIANGGAATPVRAAGPTSLRACLRLLPRPTPAAPRRDGCLQLSGADLGNVAVRTWHGPERLSGQWWDDAYDRDYYWALARDGRAFWVYRDRVRGGWFLHGWLD